jgi:hypothetical protein
MSRPVASVIDAVATLEGGGFPVRRPFPIPRLDHVDPFLLLDEMGPVDWGPGKAIGAPDHPHRGFETVTYLLDGRMRHKDSRGNTGALGPGDVQWMTAGAGVVHSEMPDPDFNRTGGRVHGFQLWVNLPRAQKMLAPRYQDTPAARIPEVTSADGRVRVRVIAGVAMGAQAVIETHTPILYAHFTLKDGGTVDQPIPEGFSVFAYVFSGEGMFGPQGSRAREGQLVLFGEESGGVTFGAAGGGAGRLDLLLLGGVPLREPIARYGPFVMNTDAEIKQAFDDYRHGRMGQIEA